MKTYPFSALFSRMKYITRWCLMRSTRPESLSEHTADTAMLAHTLCLIGRHCTGTGAALRPEGVAAPADGQQHLQFGKVRTDDGRTFFCAFTDRARLLQWRNMGSVELGVKDYAPLVLSSNDTGIIIDPGVGSGLALTREMLQTLKAQLEFFEQMRSTAAELGVDFDAAAVAEAARNITANDDEPEGRNRKERRWFGKKKK